MLYSRLGGIAQCAQQFERRTLTLRQISKILDCSHETARNDLIQYLGKSRYQQLMHNRKSHTAPKIITDLKEARKFIEQNMAGLPISKSENIKLLLKALDQFEQEGIALKVELRKTGTLRFFLPNNRTVKFLTANITGKRKEHQLGVHKFGIAPSLNSQEILICVLGYGHNITIYVFDRSEICNIKSLNLRYKWFDRRSKYVYARDRWVILL